MNILIHYFRGYPWYPQVTKIKDDIKETKYFHMNCWIASNKLMLNWKLEIGHANDGCAQSQDLELHEDLQIILT